MIHENDNAEYQSQMLEDLYKEVIAFTNTDGNVIYTLGLMIRATWPALMMWMKLIHA